MKRLLLIAAVVGVTAGATHSAPAVGRGSASRLPRYGPVSYVGRSHEFGSVYVTDAIGSADFNGDGLPDVVYATANSGSTSTFALQFALNHGESAAVERVVDEELEVLDQFFAAEQQPSVLDRA